MRPTLIFAAVIFGAQTPAEHAAHPVVSPTGRQIVFNSSRDGTPDLYVMNADGSGVVRLTNSAESEGVGGWSTDGNRVMFTVVMGDTLRVYSIGVDAKGVKEIGRVVGRAARVTGDGATIVYGAGPWPSMQLFAAPINTPASAKRLTPGVDAFWCQALSRDGRIAATRSSRGDMQIAIMNLDGSGARNATRFPPADGGPQCASWSPDGKRLAVQSETNKTGHIWIVDVATGAARKIAEHSAPYVDETPSWFPDGKRVAFQSDRTGRWEIWVADVDGGAARQLSK